MSQPTTYDNPLTRMIERAKERNMGVERREAPVDAGASPSARSAVIGREVETPLTIAERAELDEKARALGILPKEAGEDNPYPTLADAMNAGSAVPDEVPVPAGAWAGEVPVKKATVSAFPRLPDFTKVGGIDLIRDVVYVDSMEFPISKADADEFRFYVIQIAHNVITQRLNEAVAALGVAVGEATRGEDVLKVQGEQVADGVSAEPQS